MRLTIVETGLPPEPLREAHPDYPAMFRRLLSPAAPDLDFDTVSPVKGEPYPDPAGLDAVLITGSPAGVYDPEPWLPGLMEFIRWAAAEHTPQVGICFGHQAIAHALGGHAQRSDKGWGVGRHEYEIRHAASWIGTPPPETFAISVSHQDQVVTAPPGARSVAASDFTPFAALQYDVVPAISFQGHPEFDDDFASALYALRRGRIGDKTTDLALQSLSSPHDNEAVARWIAGFLRANARAR